MIPIRDTQPSRTVPLMMYGLVLANVVVFLFQTSLPPEQLRTLIYIFGLVPARYTHLGWAAFGGFRLDDYWPFLTNIFLHGGWAHLIGNMWSLYIFGDNVEDRMGSFRFLIFYLICGLTAGIVHWATNPHSTMPTVGASGAIAGVMGAYFLMFPRSQIIMMICAYFLMFPRSQIIMMIPIFFFPFFFAIPAFTYLIYWFVLQVFSGATTMLSTRDVGGIAWWAHVGGFLAGALLHRLFVQKRKKWQPPLDYWAGSAKKM